MSHYNCIMADCAAAEFGWEAVIWQARVRHMRSLASRLIVVTTEGREALYAQCGVDEFITHRVPMVRDVWRATKIHDAHAWVCHCEKVKQALHREGVSIRITAGVGYHKWPAVYVKYGEGTPKGNYVALHARHRRVITPNARRHNWPQLAWDRVSRGLSAAGIRTIAVGLVDESLLPDGAEDARGSALETTIGLLAGAVVVAGPSSGPIHLASLCGTPHVVWTHRGINACINATNRKRYEVLWNPHRTPCTVLDTPETTSPDYIIKTVIKEYERHSNACAHSNPELQPAQAT